MATRIEEALSEQMSKAATINNSLDDFTYFVNHIFARSFDDFVGGEYINDVCELIQNNRNTIFVGPRDHFKSTRLYAKVMWNIWRMMDAKRSFEGQYFSYSQEMAGYHISKIKELIKRNPWFADCIDAKEIAGSVLKMTWDGDHFYTLNPRGLLTFKRGIHCDDVFIDDPLRDPENKMMPTVIKKVNDIIKTQIMSMPNKDTGQIHCVGTPQTNYDFFFDTGLRIENGGSFRVKIQPAIVSYEKRVVLWPEYWPFDRLMQKKADLSDDRVFNQEFMCSPVYSENAYLDMELLRKRVNADLNNLSAFVKIPEETIVGYNVIAGWDLGKKAHPAHFTVFMQDEKGFFKQIHEKWFDHWDYTNGRDYIPEHPTQLEYIKHAIKNFHIDYVFYDATRGELETMKENGALPSEFRPVIFTVKVMHSMANDLQQLIINNNIELIDDERQISQMLMVNNDLDALQSPEGHGDSFWSNAMVAHYKESVRTFTKKPAGW